MSTCENCAKRLKTKQRMIFLVKISLLLTWYCVSLMNPGILEGDGFKIEFNGPVDALSHGQSRDPIGIGAISNYHQPIQKVSIHGKNARALLAEFLGAISENQQIESLELDLTTPGPGSFPAEHAKKLKQLKSLNIKRISKYSKSDQRYLLLLAIAKDSLQTVELDLDYTDDLDSLLSRYLNRIKSLKTLIIRGDQSEMYVKRYSELINGNRGISPIEELTIEGLPPCWKPSVFGNLKTLILQYGDMSILAQLNGTSSLSELMFSTFSVGNETVTRLPASLERMLINVAVVKSPESFASQFRKLFSRDGGVLLLISILHALEKDRDEIVSTLESLSQPGNLVQCFMWENASGKQIVEFPGVLQQFSFGTAMANPPVPATSQPRSAQIQEYLDFWSIRQNIFEAILRMVERYQIAMPPLSSSSKEDIPALEEIAKFLKFIIMRAPYASDQIAARVPTHAAENETRKYRIWLLRYITFIIDGSVMLPLYGKDFGGNNIDENFDFDAVATVENILSRLRQLQRPFKDQILDNIEKIKELQKAKKKRALHTNRFAAIVSFISMTLENRLFDTDLRHADVPQLIDMDNIGNFKTWLCDYVDFLLSGNANAPLPLYKAGLLVSTEQSSLVPALKSARKYLEYLARLF